jgi:hypothetical protein
VTSCDQHLAALRAALQPLETEVRELGAGLGDEQLHWAAEPGRWSIAQCMEHLVVIAQRYHPRLAAAMDQRSTTSGATEYRPTWVGRRLVDAMRDTTGRRHFRAPRLFQPDARPAPGAPERLLATQRELGELLTRAAGVDLVRVKVRSPVMPLLRLNLGETLELQVVHIARHLAQARRVREHADFPARAT